MRALPFLGVGLSYRWSMHPIVMRSRAQIDWLEITPEHFLPLGPDGERRLELLARSFPLVGHSLELSIGADGPDDASYRARLTRVLGVAGALWHGDHLCFTRVRDLALHALTPVPFCDDALEVCTRNIRDVQRGLDAPFIIENITYYIQNPLSAMDEATFIRRVVLGADCGLLLDLHNVLANAINHRYDPYRFIDQLPLDRVVQIHLAGGEDADGLRLDTHASWSPDEVWALLDYVVPRCPVRGVNFEMDVSRPPSERLLEELARAGQVLDRCGAKTA